MSKPVPSPERLQSVGENNLHVLTDEVIVETTKRCQPKFNLTDFVYIKGYVKSFFLASKEELKSTELLIAPIPVEIIGIFAADNQTCGTTESRYSYKVIPLECKTRESFNVAEDCIFDHIPNSQLDGLAAIKFGD